MTTELAYDNLPVGIRKAASGDSYEIGVTVAGSFQVFGQFKAGGFDEDLVEAKADTAQQQPAPEPPTPAQQ